MAVYIGPYRRDRVVLCSADAGLQAQRKQTGKASELFPGAKWVATVRNVADRLDCRFVILTTGHGMVDPDTPIKPYSVNIDDHPLRVERNWSSTILRLLGGNQHDILVFYRGSCPATYIPMLQPILRSVGISLLSFGRPNLRDISILGQLTNLILQGTTYEELKSILGWPEELRLYPR